MRANEGNMYFSFSHPSYLYYLFFIPAAIFFHFYLLGSSKKASLEFANFEAIARIKGIELYSKNISVLMVTILIVVCVVFFMSGLTLHREIEGSSLSYIIAIDASQSMGATDFIPNRLSVAQETSRAFVRALPDESLVGVISFAGNAFIEQELTKNKDLLEEAINKITLTPYGGTDMYEALLLSLTILRTEEAKSIIILSDGQITVGSIEGLIDQAREENVIIHTIAMGTLEGGVTSYGLSTLDEDTLSSLAYNTGGQYFRIENAEDMRNVFKEIIKLKTVLVSTDLSFYLGIITIILLFLQQIIIARGRISL